MGLERPHDGANDVESATADQFTGDLDPAAGPAWEEVAAGRYMPRRIKGSCKGRSLG